MASAAAWRCGLRWSLMVLALALLAQQAAARPHDPSRALSAAVDLPEEPPGPARERFIVVLKPRAVRGNSTVAKMAQRILSQILTNDPTVGATGASAAADTADPTGDSAPEASLVDVIEGDPKPPSSHHAAHGILAFVAEATDRAADLLRRHPDVAAVFPDFPVTLEPGLAQTAEAAAEVSDARAIPAAASACRLAPALSRIPAHPASAFRWQGCMVAGNTLSYITQRCGADNRGLLYTALVAVDARTGMAAQFQGKPCILERDAAKPPAWTRQRFGGGCGKAPTLMAPRSMPTAVCPGPPTPPGYPCASAGADGTATAVMTLPAPVLCGSESATTLEYAGEVCGGEGSSLVQWSTATTPGGCVLTPASGPAGDAKWVSDYFGSCGVPPAATNEKVFTACAMSPEPLAPRMPLTGGETVPTGVRRIEVVKTVDSDETVPDGSVWDSLPPERRVAVAIIDSGIDSTHPDLRLGYMGGETFLKVNVTKDPRDADPGVDPIGHGTNIAGVLGAANNGRGVVGVSPGIATYSLKVISASGSGSLSYVLSAIKWVITKGADFRIRVLNISIVLRVDETSPYYEDTYTQVCAFMQEASRAGIVIVNSAGNDGRSILNYMPTAVPHGGGRDGAVAPAKRDGAYSNYLPASKPAASRERVVAAPGYADPTTAPLSYSNGYMPIGGTSLAAPHVAGVFANCIMAGACKGTPVDMLRTIRTAAGRRAARLPPYNNLDTGLTTNDRYYGWLVWNGY